MMSPLFTPLLCASLLCSSALAQAPTHVTLGNTAGLQFNLPPKLSAGERISNALLFPGATHYKLGQGSRGALYLGLTSATLLVGLSLVATAYAKERAYMAADASPMHHREAADSLYEQGNRLLWVAAAIWGVSVFDAWLGEHPGALARLGDEEPEAAAHQQAAPPAPSPAKPKAVKAQAKAPPVTMTPKAQPVAVKPKAEPAAVNPKAKPAAVKPKAKPAAVKPKAKPAAASAKAVAQRPHAAAGQPKPRSTTPQEREARVKISQVTPKVQGQAHAKPNQLRDPFGSLAAETKTSVTKPQKATKEASPKEPAQVTLKQAKPSKGAEEPRAERRSSVIFGYAPEGRFSLQLRAFTSERVARRYVSRHSKLVTPLRVYQATHKGRLLYRVRLGRFKGRAAARAALTKYLELKGTKAKPIIVTAERNKQ